MTKIMLVEDDDNLRDIYAARLIGEGYEIISAKDGEEALDLALKEQPDLLISDVMMPKISGFDMLDILRNSPKTSNIQVIMMTALSQAEDKDRAERLGADRYLVKSQVTLEDVVKVVNELLGTPAAPQDEQEPLAPITGVDLSAISDPAPAQAPEASTPTPETPTPQVPQTPDTTTPPADTPTPEQPATPPAPEAPTPDQQSAQGAPISTVQPAGDPDAVIEQPEPTTITPTVQPDAVEQPSDSESVDSQPAQSPETPPEAPTPDQQPAQGAPISTVQPADPAPAQAPEASTPTPETPTPQVPQTPDTTTPPADTPTPEQPATPPAPEAPVAPDSTISESSIEKAEEIVSQDAESASSELQTIENQIKDFVNSDITQDAPPISDSEAESKEIAINEDGTVSKVPSPEETPTNSDSVAPSETTPQAQVNNTPEQIAAEQPQVETDNSSSVTTTAESDVNRKEKKVINPINDLSSPGPDLNALLAKEEAKSQMNIPAQQASENVSAAPQNPASTDAQSPGNISL